MAKSILDIVIKLTKQGGADKETIKEMVKVKSAIMDTAAVAGTLVAAGFAIKKGFDATVGALVNYADKVRNIQNATGATAEDASKLIQILDDQKVSFEQLQTVVAKNGKTYDYSIAGLGKMSDEYLKLTDANEQAAFMQERFGKQWISFVPVMKQGKDAINAASDAVDKNLVLTEKSMIQTRLWEIQVDNAKDAWDGYMMSIGKGVLGILDGSTAEITKNAQAIFYQANGFNFNTNMSGRYTDAQREAWEQAKAQAEQEWMKANALDNSAESTDAAAQSAEEYAEALKAQSKANTELLGLITNVASAEQSYQQTAAQLAQERVQIEQERAAAITAGWWEGSEKIKEYDAALAENSAAMEEAAAKHHEAMGKIQYDLLVAKLSVDGLTEAEFGIAQQAGIMFGVFDEGSAKAAADMNTVAQAVAEGKLRLEDMQRVLEMLKKGYSFDVVMNIIQNVAAGNVAPSREEALRKAGQNPGYAEGGVSSGPASGHWELLHGTEAIIPLQNGSVPVQMSAPSMAGGGDQYYVTLSISSPMTILDEQKTRSVLLPYIVDGIKQVKARGM